MPMNVCKANIARSWEFYNIEVQLLQQQTAAFLIKQWVGRYNTNHGKTQHQIDVTKSCDADADDRLGMQ